VICPSCSHLYKADAFILVGAGLMGGKGSTNSELSFVAASLILRR
jgi:hypothetical protein